MIYKSASILIYVVNLLSWKMGWKIYDSSLILCVVTYLCTNDATLIVRDTETERDTLCKKMI